MRRPIGFVSLGALAAVIGSCQLPPGMGGPAEPPQPLTSPPSPARFAPEGGITIGMEYVLLDNPGWIHTQASILSEIGAPAAKPIAESHSWGAMQGGPAQPIDFTRLDNYVRDFQHYGFTETTLALKSHSNWASVQSGLLRTTDATPKPQYRTAYADWVRAIVERYDHDGVDDMEGLRFPIRHYEIGSEFSSYEPEPAEDYLVMLELAYEAAHAAYEDVLVSHAAFLTTDFFVGDPPPEEWPDRFDVDRYGPHTLAEIRAILDRPDLFDVLNIHALGHPGEIEQMVSWLDWEMDQRNYRKPIIISAVALNPFVAWGPATFCDRPRGMGIVIYPATEEDRCRIADYFNRVIDGERFTRAWTRTFVAADNVKKVIIAAEQGIELINTAFTTDLPILDSRAGQAGAGNSGWGGMIDIPSGARYPNFHALRQLVGHLGDYRSIRREPMEGPEGARLYRIEKADGPVWVGWYDPPYLVLPGEDGPEAMGVIPVGETRAMVESMVERMSQESGIQRRMAAPTGVLRVPLSPWPIYVWPAS